MFYLLNGQCAAQWYKHQKGFYQALGRVQSPRPEPCTWGACLLYPNSFPLFI